MPMPKGTKPNPREWVECSLSEMRHAIYAMRRKGITVLEMQRWNQTLYRDENGAVLARHYMHGKSDQCLVAVSHREYLPAPIVSNMKEGSIYNG